MLIKVKNRLADTPRTTNVADAILFAAYSFVGCGA
jgi:hypothetical protein